MTLGQEIERAKQRDQIAKWDEGERKLAAELRPVNVQITEDVITRFSIFGKWCLARSARKLPAKPTTVAAFVLEQRDLGATPQIILSLLAAIEAVHNSHSLVSVAKDISPFEIRDILRFSSTFFSCDVHVRSVTFLI